MASPPDQRTLVVVVPGSGPVVDELRRLLPDGFEVRGAGGGDDPATPLAAAVVVVVVDAATTPLPGGPAPVLAVVARAAHGGAVGPPPAGALDVLPHPFDGSEVRSRIAAATRLASAEARLAARNASLAAWADRAGHDLTTPLAVISGMAETLEAAWDRLAEADRARLLGSIRNQAAKAMAMLDEGVALARDQPPPAGAAEAGPAGGGR